MTKKKIVILEPAGGPWIPFLKNFFSDSFSEVVCAHDRDAVLPFFSKSRPAMVFVAPSFLSLPFLQKIKVQRQTNPSFRAYVIGDGTSLRADPVFSASFDFIDRGAFGQKWAETLPLPGSVSLLVIDDEEEIGVVVCDYFRNRHAPVFQVRYARNGIQGFQAIEKGRPDLIILDIKMPEMDGREFYAELGRRGLDIPVVIFFDSISGDEIREIRKYGNPPVAEKGNLGGSLLSLAVLVKKTLFFEGQ